MQNKGSQGKPACCALHTIITSRSGLFRRITEPLSVDTVISVLAEVFKVPVEEFHHRRRDSALRGIAGRFLVRYAGLTQREAAAKIGVGRGGAVSRQMHKVRVLWENDQCLRQLVG